MSYIILFCIAHSNVQWHLVSLINLITFFDLKKTEFINEHKKIELETKQKFTSNQLKLLGKISLLNELLEDLK